MVQIWITLNHLTNSPCILLQQLIVGLILIRGVWQFLLRVRSTVDQKLSQLSFVIVTHVAFTGHAQELEAFLKEHSSILMFIGLPFLLCEPKRINRDFYEKGIRKRNPGVYPN